MGKAAKRQKKDWRALDGSQVRFHWFLQTYIRNDVTVWSFLHVLWSNGATLHDKRCVLAMQVEEFLEKKTRDERLGPSVDTLPDKDLFFVDKQPDTVPNVQKKRVSRKELYRNKLTRAQAIIQVAHGAEPVVAQSFSKKKNGILRKTPHKVSEESKRISSKELEKALVPKEGGYDIFSKDTVDFDIRNKAIKAVKSWKKSLRNVPAVEIDASGCSINPDYESHQEAVAEAVAAEMKKQYDRELLPEAPPKVVEWEDYEAKGELEKLLVESDSEEEMDSQESDSSDNDAARGTSRHEKKTVRDRNRQAKNKALERENEMKKKEKRQRRDLENLRQISQEVTELEVERDERRQRRREDIKELENTAPPRLGKHKFTPLPIQVLTTEEIKESGGSLRKIKPTPILAKERYKSLQRRGIIEPRVKAQKSGRQKKFIIHGKREDNAQERHDEIRDLKTKNKKMKGTGK